MPRYKVNLTEAQQQRLRQICSKGTHNARVLMRARLLLLLHEGKSRAEIARALGVNSSTVTDVAKRYILHGLERALYDAPRPGFKRVFDASDEAKLIAIACSNPPDGYECWSIKLLTKEINRRTNKQASNSTVARILMNNHVKPWQQKNVVRSKDYA